MSERQLLARITLDPKVIVGKPIIRGTRLTVEHVLNLLAHDATVEAVLEEHAALTREDIRACLLFAAAALEDMLFLPLETGAA